jgi:FSR family fosmidomycin resistance protein-like MFS transporter
MSLIGIAPSYQALLLFVSLGSVGVSMFHPTSAAMVSSLMMGLAWGIGGMMTPLVGKLADLFSIRPVLASLAIIPLITVCLIARLPDTKEAARHPALT